MKKPSYMTDGSRGIEGSGTTNSFTKSKTGAGQLTPPGLVSFPAGPESAEYQNGAVFTAKAAGDQKVAMTPLMYHSDPKEG
jgi:hypothetical protein